jgi:hypothetical protein
MRDLSDCPRVIAEAGDGLLWLLTGAPATRGPGWPETPPVLAF